MLSLRRCGGGCGMAMDAGFHRSGVRDSSLGARRDDWPRDIATPASTGHLDSPSGTIWLGYGASGTQPSIAGRHMTESAVDVVATQRVAVTMRRSSWRRCPVASSMVAACEARGSWCD